MQWLVAIGADVNARSTLDESPLSDAIAYGSMDTIHFLLEQGANIHHGNLLHHAALRSDQQEGALLVEDLARRGTDVNAYRFDSPGVFRWRATYKQLTPLHVACGKMNIPVARALLQNSADPYRRMLHAREDIGQSSMEMALESQDEGLRRLFQDDDETVLS